MDFLKHLRKKDSDTAEPAHVQIGSDEVGQLSSTFAPPGWLWNLGRTSWLLVGVFVLMAALVWVLGTTATIVGPVVVAMIVATVSMPVVEALSRHMPRAAAAGIVLLLLAALAVFVVVIVIGGITSQRSSAPRVPSRASSRTYRTSSRRW